MLQVKNIRKQYQIGEYIQNALDGVSLNLRDNEFVAILGPSGSGKTTLLNIIGGLDRYDDGDLIINEISTKNYKDKDWDSYRNHTIGFVFQSYNLIAHQSVLTNVELALTISGISKSDRKKRAMDALEQVGLKDHVNKKPNQMSGGQMQRVAIARALVNNPDILLADEPTGALDSETSVQIMELLKDVAQERLVVMVTHNPELAEEYATRIVKLRDGKIIDDNNSFVPKNQTAKAEHKNMGKSSMSFLTSLSLSFNNLKTKKGRTILTAFAGSIGIIGIALILALSSGVSTYIEDIQKETMSSYPITIDSQTFDLESMMGTGGPTRNKRDETIQEELNGIYADVSDLQRQENMRSNIIENDLTNFKIYLDDPTSEIRQYLGENGIVYTYDVQFDVFAIDGKGVVLNTNTTPEDNQEISPDSEMDKMYSMMGMESTSGVDNFSELIATGAGDGISAITTDSYEVLAGEWPQEYNEVILVLDSNNHIDISTLYSLGFITLDEYEEITETIENGETVNDLVWSYEEIIGYNFYVVPYCDYYAKNEDGTFSYISETISEAMEQSLELEVVGIIKAKEDAANATINTNVAYLRALTNYIIEYTDSSAVVMAQEADEETNILNGLTFEILEDKEKVEVTKTYLSNMSSSEKASFYTTLMSMQGASVELTTEEMVMALDQWLLDNPSQEILLSVFDTYIGESTYTDNITAFGKVSLEAPKSISIYTDSFEDKEAVAVAIENYNTTVEEEEEINYTDFVALLTSSLTSIVDVISYVLIAFVSVSLVVSCIMIGIITHISVMERTKEIGILRAIGASKKNISQVFNAETLIIGLCAGAIGVGISTLLTIPINAIVHMLTSNESLNAKLPLTSAVILVFISVIITVLAGLIPAKKAAKKDPVIALRSE